MGRPVTDHVAKVKQKLRAKILARAFASGQRFLSNRGIAAQLGISYQTADRIVRELVREGLLVRRAGSGTYLPGERRQLGGVQLIFHRRARRKSSFGARLLSTIVAGLNAANVEWRMNWFDPATGRLPRLMRDRYPIIWEARPAVKAACAQQRMALLINERPPPGLAALHFGQHRGG